MKNVIDRDRGYNAIMRALGLMPDSVTAYVGLRGADDSELVEHAAANEFGTQDGSIPERSFLRSTVAEHQAKYQKQLDKAVGDAVDGKAPLAKGLGLLGERAKRDVQRKIRDLKEPPNAALTIALKGSSNPLIDTGRMRQSIDYVIEVER